MESGAKDYSRTVSISMGGSVLSKDEGYNAKFAEEFCGLIAGRPKERFLICVGGGSLNRKLLKDVSGSVSNKAHLDELGIAVTRINALILKDIMVRLGADVNESIPTSLDQVKSMYGSHRVTVFGGLSEGVTTDADAVLAAEFASAKLVLNVSDSPYVYDKDPKEKGARKLERLSHAELIGLAKAMDDRAPKARFIFDYVACLLSARSGIKVLFVGSDAGEIKAALDGRPHKGTTVE